MFVVVTAEFDAACPVVVLALAKVTVGAPVPDVYPPPVVSSVPFAVLDPFAVMYRT
jgi:hypothetical protein